MPDLRVEVLEEFRKVAETCDAVWQVADTYCQLHKNGITMRVRWAVERIKGVFVTLTTGTEEYGLPYLVEFRGGSASDFEAARSDNPKSTAEIARRYALPFLEAQALDFRAFLEFVEKRVSENARATPIIHANNTIRPGYASEQYN